MLRAVIFDIDGTLYDYSAAHAAAFRALTDYARAAFGLTAERFDALHREADHLLRQRCGHTAALHNRLIRYQIMLERTGRSIAAAPEMAGLYWRTLIDAMTPYPGLRDALTELRRMGLRIGTGTNMTAEWQFAKLKRLDLMELVDFMVTSEEAGAEKPDRRLFDLCAEKAGCPNAECAFVGDSLNGDALGAEAAGMRGILFDPCHRADALPDIPRIAALSELPKLLMGEL